MTSSQTAGLSLLLVEDDEILANTVARLLEAEGFRVVVAADGLEAMEHVRREPPALVLLDLMLPRLSGLDVCRLVRQESTVPILVLTAKSAEADKVSALELGADDFVTKPFSTRELVSRIRAQLRRAGMTFEIPQPDVLRAGPVELDVARHEARVYGAPISLPPREFDLLELLLARAGRLLTRDFLILTLWGADYYGDTRTLDVHIKRLRQKIEPDPHHPVHLLTVRGLGYRFVENGAHPKVT